MARFVPQLEKLSHVHRVELLCGLRVEIFRDVGQLKVRAVLLRRKVAAKHVADPLRPDEGLYRAERDQSDRALFYSYPEKPRPLAFTFLLLIIIAFSVASYAIADLFLFTVALVFTDTTFVLATIPSVLAFVRSATFLTSILTIITICKLYVLLGIGRPSPE